MTQYGGLLMDQHGYQLQLAQIMDFILDPVAQVHFQMDPLLQQHELLFHLKIDYYY